MHFFHVNIYNQEGILINRLEATCSHIMNAIRNIQMCQYYKIMKNVIERFFDFIFNAKLVICHILMKIEIIFQTINSLKIITI